MANEMPSAEWDLPKLADYARKLVRRVKIAPRRIARDVFLMGSALVIVRDRMKIDGEYDRWLAKNRLPKTTAYHAVRLAEHFKTADALGKLTISQAKQAAGLIKSKAKPAPAFVQPDAPAPLIRLDAAIKAVMEGGDELATREDFRQLVAELVKLADLHADAVKGKGRKGRVIEHARS